MTLTPQNEHDSALSRQALSRLTGIVLLSLLTPAGCNDYTQQEQDRDTLIGFDYFFNDDWNANIAYGSAGAIDYTVRGTDCGTLHVTGQFEASTLSFALLYAFDGYCFSGGSSWRSVSIKSITGEISVSGVLEQARVFTAEGLAVDGTVKNDNEDKATLDDVLALNCTVARLAGSGTVNDRDTVTWDYGGGSSNTDDSSSAACSIDCGSVSNGIEVTGAAIHAATCGQCPSNTNQTGIDNVTANGPYYVCTCIGY